MGIRAFVKAANRRKPRPLHPNWVELQKPSSPLDVEPDDPEIIAGYLAAVSKTQELIDLRNPSHPLLHTVRVGETFQSIAHDFFGDAALGVEIAAANLMPLDETLKVGTMLSIPQQET